ncbi:lamin tail domain-containing protein [Methanothrix harundinacea]|jgi:hypothetical protein|uniref:lamin tail domain-containing protein n=1 Tax=Methanothrix harundinacea TaxID=301375 RepID=UPI00064E2A9C|nr:lamin tail domain-containing protein [Methanothrix harundinacea]
MKRDGVRLLASLLGVLASTMACLGGVVINEVELGPPEGGNEWVELYNNGIEEVDVSRWSVWIVDQSPSWTGVMKIPQDTVMAPGSFFVAEGDRQWIHNTGTGTVILKTDEGAVVDETPLLSDHSNNFFTNFRHPNGFDSDQRSDWVFGIGTKNAPNS